MVTRISHLFYSLGVNTLPKKEKQPQQQQKKLCANLLFSVVLPFFSWNLDEVLNNYYHLTQFSIFIVQGTKERTRLHTKKTEKRECTARLSKENDRDNYFIESEKMDRPNRQRSQSVFRVRMAKHTRTTFSVSLPTSFAFALSANPRFNSVTVSIRVASDSFTGAIR